MGEIRNVSVNGGNKYEWEQSFDDITVYIDIPQNTKREDIRVNFKTNYISIEIDEHGQNRPRQWKGHLFSTIETSESTWTIEDTQCQIHISKARPGEVWKFFFKGDQGLTGTRQQDEQKRLLLERFQREHPGFDFTDAEMEGVIPEPRTFMKNL